MSYTEEQKNALEKFERLFRSGSSMRFKYDKNDIKIVSTFHEYTPVGENLEIDTWGMVIREDESYFYVYPHLRNRKTVSKTFLAEMLSSIREFLLDRIKNSNFTIQDIGNLPEDFRLKFPIVTVDPGFKGHREPEERTTGIRISNLNLWYPEITNVSGILDGGMKMKQVLMDPREYYLDLKFNTVDRLNTLLAQSGAQKNKLKKLQIKNDLLLKSPGKFLIKTDPEVPDLGTGTYKFEGPHPHLKYAVSHNPDEHGVVKATWWFAPDYTDGYDVSGKNNGHFVLHLPRHFEEQLEELEMGPTNKKKIIENFKKQVDEIFIRHDIIIDWYGVQPAEFVYDL